jgi:hypothetical protein
MCFSHRAELCAAQRHSHTCVHNTHTSRLSSLHQLNLENLMARQQAAPASHCRLTLQHLRDRRPLAAHEGAAQECREDAEKAAGAKVTEGSRRPRCDHDGRDNHDSHNHDSGVPEPLESAQRVASRAAGVSDFPCCIPRRRCCCREHCRSVKAQDKDGG